MKKVTTPERPKGPAASKLGMRLVLAAAAVAILVVVLRGAGIIGPPPGQTGSEDAPLAGSPPSAADWQAWAREAAQSFELGQFDQAVKAYGAALELAPSVARLWSARGEARVMAGGREPLPDQALKDFQTAIRLDPKDPRARYFLAVKQDLDGDHKGAIESWLALLADTPRGAVWEADLRRTIEQVGKINAIDVKQQLAQTRGAYPQPAPSLAGIPGPSAEDLKRAASLRPAEQRKMAEDMVARLEGRLRSDPANPEGWSMLIRSRMTLGQPELARAALEQAISANPGAAVRLREQAAILGLNQAAAP